MIFTARVPLLREFFKCRMDAIGNLKDPGIRDYVYSRLAAGGGTTKQTAVGRFRDLDDIIVSLAHKDKINVVHDIAVSSGVTSLELYSTLHSHGLPTSFRVSDKYAKYGATGRALVRIADADGTLVEMYACGVLAKRNVSKYFFLTRLLYWLLADVAVHNRTKVFFLFDAQVLEHIERGLIYHIDYDVFETRTGSLFTFVRCMNLLNLDRFSSSQIQGALSNIVGSLQENGVLQIGRTMSDGRNMVGFYLKTDHGLQLLKEVGGGTELRDMLKGLCGHVVKVLSPE